MRVLSVSLHQEGHVISRDAAIGVEASTLSLPCKLLEVERGQKPRLLPVDRILWAESHCFILVFLNCPWAFELVINDNLLLVVLSVVL